MSNPEFLTLVRHDKTDHEKRQLEKASDQVYQAFRRAYDKNWASTETQALAYEVSEKFSAAEYGDYNVPLLPVPSEEISLAEAVAAKMRTFASLPDTIYVSPSLRTMQTLERMSKGWPDLKTVRTIEEPNLRERDLGLAWLWCDFKVWDALHPEEGELHRLLGDYYYRFPRGESISDVRQRGRTWVTNLSLERNETNVLAVTHRVNILSIQFFQCPTTPEVAASGQRITI